MSNKSMLSMVLLLCSLYHVFVYAGAGEVVHLSKHNGVSAQLMRAAFPEMYRFPNDVENVVLDYLYSETNPGKPYELKYRLKIGDEPAKKTEAGATFASEDYRVPGGSPQLGCFYDGRVALAVYQSHKGIALWNMVDKVVEHIELFKKGERASSRYVPKFSPTGKYLAWSISRTFTMFDLHTKQRQVFPRDRTIQGICFSPDETFFVTSQIGKMHVWCINPAIKEDYELPNKGQQRIIRSLFISEQHRLVGVFHESSSTDKNNVIYLWKNVREPHEPCEIDLPKDSNNSWLWNMQLLPCGNKVATYSETGMISYYDISAEKLHKMNDVQIELANRRWLTRMYFFKNRAIALTPRYESREGGRCIREVQILDEALQRVNDMIFGHNDDFALSSDGSLLVATGNLYGGLDAYVLSGAYDIVFPVK